MKRLEFLVARAAEPRIKLEDARAGVKALEGEQTRLPLAYTSAQAARENRARVIEGEAVSLEAQRRQVQERQLVRSPFAGEVGEVRLGAATPQGVSVEVVLIVQAQ